MNKKGNVLINVLALCIVIGLIITSFVLVTSPKFKIQDEITMDGTVIGGNGGSSNPDEPQQDIIKRLYIEVVDDDTSFNIENFSFYDKINSGSQAITNTKEYDFVVGHTYVFSAPGYIAKDIAITSTETSPLKVTLKEIGQIKEFGLTEVNNVPFNVYKAESPNSNPLVANKQDSNTFFYSLAVGSQYIISADNYTPITIYIQESSNSNIKFTLKKPSDQSLIHPYTIMVKNTSSFIVREDNTLEVINPKNGYYYLENGKDYRVESNIDHSYYAPYKIKANGVYKKPIEIVLDKYFNVEVTNIGNESFSIYKGVGNKFNTNKVNKEANGKYKLTELSTYTISKDNNADSQYKDYTLVIPLNTDPKKPIQLALGLDYKVTAHPKNSNKIIEIASITDSKGKVINKTPEGNYTLEGDTYTLNTNIYFPATFTIKEAVEGVIDVELDNRYKITAKNSNSIIVYDTIKPTTPISPDNDGLYTLTENHSYIIKGNDPDTTNKTITISIYPNTNHVIEVKLAEYYKISVTNPIGFIVHDTNTDAIVKSIDGQYELNPNHKYNIIPDIDPYDNKGYAYTITNIDTTLAVNNEIVLTFERDFFIDALTENRQPAFVQYPTYVNNVSVSIDNGKFNSMKNHTEIKKCIPGQKVTIKALDFFMNRGNIVQEELNASDLLPRTITIPNDVNNHLQFYLYDTYSITITNDTSNTPYQILYDRNKEVTQGSNNRYALKPNTEYRINFKDAKGRFDTTNVKKFTPKNFDSSDIVLTLPELFTINAFDISTGTENTLVIEYIKDVSDPNNIVNCTMKGQKWVLTPGPDKIYDVKLSGINDPYKLKLTSNTADINNENTINIYIGQNLSTINVTNGIPFKVYDSSGNIVTGNGNKYLLKYKAGGNNNYTIKPSYNDNQTHGYLDFTFEVTSSNPEEYVITLPREYTIETNVPIKDLYIILAGKPQLLTPFEAQKYKQILKPGSYQFEAAPYNPLSTSVGDNTSEIIKLVFELDPFLNYENITILPSATFTPINSDKVYLNFIENGIIDHNLLVPDTLVTQLVNTLKTSLGEIKTDIPISTIIPGLNKIFRDYKVGNSNIQFQDTKEIITVDFYKELGFNQGNEEYRIVIEINYDVLDNSAQSVGRTTDIFNSVTYKVKYQVNNGKKYTEINSKKIYNYNLINNKIEVLLQGYLSELQNQLSRYKVKVK